MKEVIKIVLTNWINVVSIFIAIYVAGFISAIIKDKFTFSEALFGTTYSVVGYGSVFWIGFFVVIALLDVLLFSFNREPRYTNYKLALEWIIISSPFVYWLIKYNQWIFLVAILAFLIGQYLRRRVMFQS
ncbi:MAG: hypothetical protein QM535_21515 [Limnohabitans sp.]|nr:hypothetical protein [Limnohabitans sp.]